MPSHYSDTTVILPTLNEEQNISTLISELNLLYPGIKIIVSDDGSTDTTKSKASRPCVFFLDRSLAGIHGITASVLAALQYVKTDNVIVMDADMQHPPGTVQEILLALKENDIVIASRKKILKPWSFHRKFMSVAATSLAKSRLRNHHVSDPLSGFFGIKSSLFKDLAKFHYSRFTPQSYKVLFDILKLLPKNISKKEVFYDFNMRNKGTSKIRLKHIYYFLKSLFR